MALSGSTSSVSPPTVTETATSMGIRRATLALVSQESKVCGLPALSDKSRVSPKPFVRMSVSSFKMPHVSGKVLQPLPSFVRLIKVKCFSGFAASTSLTILSALMRIVDDAAKSSPGAVGFVATPPAKGPDREFLSRLALSLAAESSPRNASSILLTSVSASSDSPSIWLMILMTCLAFWACSPLPFSAFKSWSTFSMASGGILFCLAKLFRKSCFSRTSMALKRRKAVAALEASPFSMKTAASLKRTKVTDFLSFMSISSLGTLNSEMALTKRFFA
mmetsp:Transcript_18944/g.44097  ORF Transcript_18944/g.44097 Transcript_18944/m.44097 type:complete len:277 (+) Transcript_18944:1053-1883(+)